MKLIWPITGKDGKFARFRISSPFGERTMYRCVKCKQPYNYNETECPKCHKPIVKVIEGHRGIDIACPEGSPICPVASGVLSEQFVHPRGGLSVRVDHQNGYISGYAHLQTVYAKVGDTVYTWGVIVVSGQTGLCKGAHLHLTMYHAGEVFDPWPLLKESLDSEPPE